MANYYEIDFLNVDSKRSGDAIPIRYKKDDDTYIHVVDGGFQATGDKVVAHIKKYYGNPTFIDHVVATHPDGDHAGGLRSVLEEFAVGVLWILRPWEYADELISRFARFTSVPNLQQRLKEIYPNIHALEELAIEKGIPILEPFQGASIGAFTVLAPSKARFLDMVVESEKTPEASKIEEEDRAAAGGFGNLLKRAANFIRALWGEEIFSPEETSAENEMSVVQYAGLNDERILLTGDAGRAGLIEAANYLELRGISLPGLKVFQVPHHGSRRNVSTEVLDRWLGPRLAAQPSVGTFTAAISASKEDEDHPRRAVVRGCIHRGATTVSTEKNGICCRANAPDRGWVSATPLSYPQDQEE